MPKKTILIVDDEPDAVAYLTTFLEDHDYRVLSAHNAEIGGRILVEDEPDLVLADVMLPGASGLDLILRIRRDGRFAGLPVIVISGQADILKDRCRSYLERFGVSPPDAIVEKPFDLQDVLKMVRRFLREQDK